MVTPPRKRANNKDILEPVVTSLDVLEKILRSETVKRFLSAIPVTLRRWSERRRRRLMSSSSRTSFSVVPSLRRQQSRLDALASNATLVFSSDSTGLLTTIEAAISEIRTALAVARSMPPRRRARLYMGINRRLNRLERLYAEAVLQNRPIHTAD